MATLDHMIIDDRDLANRYFGDSNGDDSHDDHYLLAKPNLHTTHSGLARQKDPRNNDHHADELFARSVHLDSPSLSNKEDEDLYRFVPTHLNEPPTSKFSSNAPGRTDDGLIDSLDFELDMLRAKNTHYPIPYRTNTQILEDSTPPAPLTQLLGRPIQQSMPHVARTIPREDSLLGPLLAELDAMTTQPQRPSASTYPHSSIPFETSLSRVPPGLPSGKHASNHSTNPPLNDAFLDADLYDSLDPAHSQVATHQRRPSIPVAALNINPSDYAKRQQPQTLPPRSSNMNGTDVFMPSSYNTDPDSFSKRFATDDQLFQQPLFNAMGQNYVPNARQPPHPSQQKQHDPYEQNDAPYENPNSRPAPAQRSAFAPPYKTPNNNNAFPRQQQQSPPPVPNRQLHHAATDPSHDYHDIFAPVVPSQAYPPSSQQPRMMPPTLPLVQQRSAPSQPQGMVPTSLPPVHQRAPSTQQRPMMPPSPSLQSHYSRPPPTQQQYDDHIPTATYPPSNREMFFTDHDDEQLDQISYRQQGSLPMNTQRSNDPQEQDSRRQAIWNELQRTNAKVQEKNAKKRETANRREQQLKGTFSSTNTWKKNGTQHSSAPAKAEGNASNQRHPLPPPGPKTNYIEENIDMIKNKENFYHRYPAKKYENLYSKRKDLGGTNERKTQPTGQRESPNDFDETQSSPFDTHNATVTYSDSNHRSSLPVTINLNPADGSLNRTLPGTVTIPLDSHVNRVGDKISVNIDLRLVDLQNLKQQQQNPDLADWHSADPLDRHIRRMERSIDQSMPPTHSPTQRSPTLSNPHLSGSVGRYGKMPTGSGQSGSNPPTYDHDHYSYSDKGREEDSYLAKMNQLRKGTHFKPYTGRDYEQFKKNYGFGTGHLGFDFDNPSFKERSDKLSKTKEYAQQVEMRNKRKLAEAPRRTLSDSRIPIDSSKTQRALEYARVATRHKLPSGTSIRSSPPETIEPAAPPRRPTEIVQRPTAVQKPPPKSAPNNNNNNELVERLAMRHERDKAQVHGILNPSQKRREPVFDDDQGPTDIERPARDRVQQRRVSPPKQAPPPGPTTNTNGRRPLRFDKPLLPDEPPTHLPSLHHRPVQQPDFPPFVQSHHLLPQADQRDYFQSKSQPLPSHQQTTVHNLANRHHDEKLLMEAIRQELSERPLGDDEELIVVEQ